MMQTAVEGKNSRFSCVCASMYEKWKVGVLMSSLRKGQNMK